MLRAIAKDLQVSKGHAHHGLRTYFLNTDVFGPLGEYKKQGSGCFSSVAGRNSRRTKRPPQRAVPRFMKPGLVELIVPRSTDSALQLA